MDNDNFGFRDDDERKAFYIALPVIALFGGLLYYFIFGSNASTPAVAAVGSAFTDSDADGIADHLDRCAAEHGTLANEGCILPVKGSNNSNKSNKPSNTQQRNATRSNTNANTNAAISSGTAAGATLPALTESVELVEPDIQEVAAEVETEVQEVAAEVEAEAEAQEGVAEAEVEDVVFEAEALEAVVEVEPVANTAVAATGVAQPVPETETQMIQDAGIQIQFEPGNATLTGKSRDILLQVAEVMQRYPDVRIEAHGFTDNQGASELNEELSQARAQACVDVIVESGVDSVRLLARGFGEANPVASNATVEGRQKNRRVEFKLVQ